MGAVVDESRIRKPSAPVLNPPKTRRLQTYTSRAMQVSADFVKRAFLLDFQRFGDGKLRLCS